MVNLKQFLMEESTINRVKAMRIFLAGFACGAVMMAVIALAGITS